MPQIDRAIVKARAASLRAVGAAALAHHLGSWVGREADALVEREGFARLADFSTVVISPSPRGEGVRGRGKARHSESHSTPPREAAGAGASPHPLPPPPTWREVTLRFTGHDGAHLIGVPV
jgi:threonylcarbamoyladenosine tRNA methylthiotransferase MtaB